MAFNIRCKTEFSTVILGKLYYLTVQIKERKWSLGRKKHGLKYGSVQNMEVRILGSHL